MAQKGYDSCAVWHCQAETSAFMRFLNDCCSAFAYLQEAIAYSRLYRKTVLNSPICKTGKTNLSTIFCKNVCVYRKITVISMKITYFLPFLPGFGAV